MSYTHSASLLDLYIFTRQGQGTTRVLFSFHLRRTLAEFRRHQETALPPPALSPHLMLRL